jgi:hypothetical protein
MLKWLRPQHTAQGVLEELISGLESGAIILGQSHLENPEPIHCRNTHFYNSTTIKAVSTLAYEGNRWEPART